MSTLCRWTYGHRAFQNLCFRPFTTSANLHKNRRIGAVKPTIGQTERLTYEQTQLPYQIGITKAWTAWNTSNLAGEQGAPDVAFEDVFIRKFMHGTWLNMFKSDLIIKRRNNTIFICGFLQRRISVHKVYFLVGYTEELLSALLERPVKLEIQTIKDDDDMVFKRM